VQDRWRGLVTVRCAAGRDWILVRHALTGYPDGCPPCGDEPRESPDPRTMGGSDESIVKPRSSPGDRLRGAQTRDRRHGETYGPTVVALHFHVRPNLASN
jgi:hypothetical protein